MTYKNSNTTPQLVHDSYIVRKNNLLDAIFVQEKSHQNETDHANIGNLHAKCTQLENIFILW